MSESKSGVLHQEYESGVIAEVSRGHVMIRTVPTDLCGSCGSKAFCRSNDANERLIKARCSIPVEPGDSVFFERDARLIAEYSVAVYLVPTLALIAGVVAALFVPLPHHELLSAASGLIFFVLALFGVRKYYAHEKRIPAVVRGKAKAK